MEIVSKAEMKKRLSGEAEYDLEEILQKIAEGVQKWTGDGDRIRIPVDLTLTTKQMDIIRSKCPPDWSITWDPFLGVSKSRGGFILIS